MIEVSTDKCRGCKHYRATEIFELCAHPVASYSIAGKTDQHTVSHMRQNECGVEARLFSGGRL